MPALKEGAAAPDFTLQANGGKKVCLKDYRKKKRVVLYFYPKDNTPGCTTEACGFKTENRKIENQEAVVFGISPDSAASHDRFVEKFKLPFLLLSDEDKKVCKAYGVWAKKKLYGREFMGVLRQTFIIGLDGKIEKIYSKVKPAEHPAEVLAWLKESR